MNKDNLIILTIFTLIIGILLISLWYQIKVENKNYSKLELEAKRLCESRGMEFMSASSWHYRCIFNKTKWRQYSFDSLQ